MLAVGVVKRRFEDSVSLDAGEKLGWTRHCNPIKIL